MAVEKETQLEAWLEENMPEPGGGNPNYIETLTGKLATILDHGNENNWNLSDFADNILSQYGEPSLNLTIYLTFTLGNQTFHLPCTEYDYDTVYYDGIAFSSVYRQGNAFLAYGACVKISNGGADLSGIWYPKDGALSGESMDKSSVTNIDATITIIHHPLPEN